MQNTPIYTYIGTDASKNINGTSVVEGLSARTYRL